VLVGALLIVCGGIALALEAERPRHVRRIGIAFALAGAALFALRDNLVRDESLATEVPSMSAGAVMLAARLGGRSSGVLVGALLIVCGGIALALEAERPRHVRRIGIAFALAGAALFALRDNLVRDESLATEVPSMTAGAVMLASSLVVTSSVVLVRGYRVVWPARVVGRWLLPGTFVGLSYIALFEAFYRGAVSVVAPIVATESLFGVGFSALLLHRTERIGPRVVAGAVLVVVGGALIAVFR
jgi:drug/metabolite transporter (DMT)-like permease